MTGDAPGARLLAVETDLAHQNRTVEELSEEVRRQGEVIDRLERTLRALAERLLNLEDTAVGRPEVTKPPHY